MGSGPSQTTNSAQSSAPWAAAQPMLQSILSTMGGLNLNPSSAQTSAAQNLQTAAGGLPTFTNATPDVNTLLSGGGASGFAPLFQGAYNTFQSGIAPLTNPNTMLNPWNTPGFGTAMNTLNTDITNQINSSAAAAGRSDSPDAEQALARGLSQGEGGLIQSQYNTNVGNLLGANQSLFNAGTGTAGNLAGLNQTTLQNMLGGITAGMQLPGLLMGPAQAQFGAANAGAQLPWQNLGWAASLVDPIAALGGQSSGTQTTTSSTNPFTTGLGALFGGMGALGSLGGTGGLPALLALSDMRAKEDIKPVGMLFEGTNVYAFRYKGDPTHRTHIGLMAQEVEQSRPDAVHEIGGVKFVDYGKATERAALAA